jgi:2-methylisocitrate lyase-like PEP mutase family enzyme
MDLSSRAGVLHELHQGPRPLVLANVWDATSAAIVEGAGFEALATSSAAVVRSLGYEDGGGAAVDEVFPAIARITRSVRVPVSADLEDGYRLDPKELVSRLLGAGAVGCNLEDADHHDGEPLVDAEGFSERIAAIKQAGIESGVDVVLNARTDVFLREVGDPAGRVDEVLRRARLYLEAGADCIFTPARNLDDHTIATVIAGVGGPVNLLVGPEPAQVARAAHLGARRISVGSGLAKKLSDQMTELVTELARARDSLGPAPTHPLP